MIRLNLRAIAAAVLMLGCLCVESGYAAGRPAIDPNFMVFGYIQSESILPFVRWNALTHISGLFTGFNSSGALTSNISGRNAALKAGGAAQAAGVKYMMVVQSFDDATGGVIETVMTDYTASGPKQTLISQIVSQITADGYCAGVNFDLEFSWGTSVRDGIADFLTKLRAALPAQYSITVYVNAFYSASQWNAPNLATNCDKILYSGYDWATGSTAKAITDQDNNVTQMNNWINAGVPAEKLVYTISAYGRRWDGDIAYGGTGSNPSSRGFTDGLYDTTLRVANKPTLIGYQTPDESAYYKYNNGTVRIVTWDSETSLEYKVRNALSLGSGTNGGKRLGGVAFWSLMWMSDMNRESGGLSFSSFDPRAGALGSSSSTNNYQYTRTYPQVYQLVEEILSPPGQTRYVFNKFESLDYRWDAFTGSTTGNYASPDNVNFSTASTRTIVAAPGGAGAPPDSTNAMRLGFTWTNAASAGKCFFRHEILNSEIDTSVPDTNSANAVFSANNKLNAYVNCSAAFTGTSVRLVVIDRDRQLEASPAYPLNTSGWQLISWDMVNTAATGLTTAESVFVNGNGTLNTDGYGARDIRFIGFLVEHTAGGTASGNIYFDELSYEPSTPGNKQYLINEFHYNNVSNEFVEITGPVGAFPSNLALVIYNSANGTASTTVSLSGKSIPASGYFVVGDPGVANLNYNPGWTASANNIPNTAPTGLQLIDAVSGCVYDSVVYGAMGGLKDLVRRGTQGVTDEGYGWMGEAASGTNGSSANYTMGRFPNGTDTNVNENDFRFMGPTPGTANGGTTVLGQTYNFTALPANLYQTYQLPRSADPVANGLPARNGSALRVVDLTGGGVMAFFDDVSLGSTGFSVTGDIYIPAAAAPAQAIAIGICGTKGSTFFPTTTASAGYEDGYWLIYENGTVGLNDDQANHSGAFQFVQATNDNMHSKRSTALGTNKTLANVGVTAGTWATFKLRIDPLNATPGERLIAQINNVDVYHGAIPTGGPTTGAFQIGFRDNSGVAISNNTEGTWLDNVSFSSLAEVHDWSIY